jgi:hypothetical protein
MVAKGREAPVSKRSVVTRQSRDKSQRERHLPKPVIGTVWVLADRPYLEVPLLAFIQLCRSE